MRTRRYLGAIATLAIAGSLAACTPSSGEDPTAPATSPSGTVTTAPSAPATDPTTAPATSDDVDHPTLAPLPRDPVEYADAFIDVWGQGDLESAGQFATVQVITDLAGLGATDWTQVSSEGTAGHTYVTYQNDTTGDQIALGIINEDASQGLPQAIDQVTLSLHPDSL